MLRRRENRKRLRLILGLGVAGVLFAGGMALAAGQTIVGTAANTYDAPTYTTNQGVVVPFQVTGSTHNVTANANGPDGRALFRSPTISGGTAGVNGTQYLTAGTYSFICTIHPSTMQATLVVSANGTPQTRPHADLKLRSKKISKVTKKGLLVEVDTNTKIDGASLAASLGKTSLGKASDVSLAAGQQFVVIKLTKAGKNKLRGRNKATVVMSADIPFGSPASGKGKLT
ncbi:MAG: hypothetical protein ACJ75Z_00905 [Solirubrobacterales bacterium]